MRSRRTTIGDAYGYLFDAGAPKPMMATMLSAMGQLGVRASLNDMFQLTARAVRASGELTPQMALENTRLKRLADVCLEAIAAERGPTKCPRPAPQPARRHGARAPHALEPRAQEGSGGPRSCPG